MFTSTIDRYIHRGAAAQPAITQSFARAAPNSRRTRTAAACLLALAGFGQGAPALAAPSTLKVCTQVLDNADANTTEGGTWAYTASNQSVAFQNPQNVRNESNAASVPTCAALAALPVGSTSLSVLQTTDAPGNWLRNAPGYPQWTISDGTHSASGSGALASLDTGTFAQFTGDTSVTFTNASGRLITPVCGSLKDNGVAPAGQTTAVTFSVLGTNSSSLNIAEGGPNVCDGGFQANIPLGAKTLDVKEGVPLTMSAGFPTVQGVGSISGTTSALVMSAAPLSYTGTLNLGATAGDVTLNFVNEIDSTRTVTVCKSLIDNADGINQSGMHTVDFGGIASLQISVTEGAASASCTPAQGVLTSATTTIVRELGLPSNFVGFAVGFPTWTIYDTNNPSVALLSGNGTVADVPWNNAALSGVQKLGVKFVDKAGAFGNGTQPNTGAVSRVCKMILDNADGVTQSGNFSIGAQSSDPATGATFAGGSTGTVNEGSLTCPLTMARWPGDNTLAAFETFTNAGWPGDAPGYPKAQVYQSSNPSAADVPMATVQMAFGSTTPYGDQYGATVNAGTGDVTLAVVNKAGGGNAAQPQTVTFCLKVNDNGLAPANDGGTWSFHSPVVGTVSATEGAAVSCLAPTVLPDPKSPAWSQPFTQFVALPTSWPGFDVIASGTPFAAYPYVQYSTTAGTSGNQSGSSGFSAFGNQMSWAGTQAFFNNAGNVTITFVAQASARYKICSQVLQNGDGVDDSNSFVLNNQQAIQFLSAPVSVTEGGAAVCSNVARFPTLGSFIASETLPANWPSSNNSSGFPQWSITSSGPAPVNQTGSSLTTTQIPQGPAAQQGDTSITFSNRLGAVRFATFCSQLLDNQDGNSDSASFGLAATSNDPAAANLGNYALNASESTGSVCGPPVALSAFATSVRAQETTPGGFVAQPGYPQWVVLDNNGANALSGSGSDTGAINLNAIATPNFTVLLKNKKADDADIAVMASGPASSIAGTQIAYQVTVSNAGPYAAPSVVLSDTAPVGLSFVSATGCGALPCNLGSIAAGTNRSITVVYSTASNYLATGGASPVSDTFAVSTTTVDTVAANNASTVTTNITASADVGIVKSGPASVVRSAAIAYTLVISNAGPSSADNTTYSDSVPAGISAVSASCGAAAGGATCANPAVSGNNVTGTVPTLPAGGSVTITISGTAPSSPTTLSNFATVSGPAGVTDPNSANNTSQTVATTVTAAGPDLAVTLSDGTTYIEGGSLVDIMITVSDINGVDATNATVRDLLPSNLTGATWTCQASATAHCTASGSGDIQDTVSIPAGQSITYLLSGTVLKLPEMPLVDMATASTSASQTDVDNRNNSRTITTTVGIYTNGFESIPTGSKRLDVQTETDAVGAVDVRLDVDTLSSAPQLVASIVDGASERQMALHVKRAANTVQARLSARGADGYWRVGAWTDLADSSELVLGWIASEASGARVLHHAELHSASGRVVAIDMP